MGKHSRRGALHRQPVTAANDARLRLARCAGLAITFGALAFTAAAPATTVDAGSEITIDGSFFADCDDVVIDGTVNVMSGADFNLNSLTIGPTGVLNAGGGTIYVATSWNNTGTFNAGTSTVRPGGACANTSTTFTGNTAFYNLNVGNHAIVLPAGGTQTVTGQLALNGTHVQSSAPGQIAYINLTPAGTQSISGVTVNNVYASGQWLAAGQSNGSGGDNANRWFGAGEAAQPALPVPATGRFALLLTGLLLLAGALRRTYISPAQRASKDI